MVLIGNIPRGKIPPPTPKLPPMNIACLILDARDSLLDNSNDREWHDHLAKDGGTDYGLY